MSEPLDERLSRFTPDAGGLDRDALLFAAGRASARANGRLQFLAGVLASCQLVAAFVLLGCSGRRVSVPSISADAAAEQAMAQYDRNQDGSLDAEELKRCPALASNSKGLDKNKDGKLSASEIAERLKSYTSSRVGLTALAVKVTLDGKPLSGAVVTLTPEKFLGDSLRPASGTTGANGTASPSVAGAEVPGIPCGLFRVEVSKKDAAGKEMLPARYNEATMLGVEIGPDHQGALRLALRSS